MHVWVGNEEQKKRVDLAYFAYQEGGQGTVYFGDLSNKMANTCIKVLNKPDDFTVQMESMARMLAHPAKPYEHVKEAGTVPLELVRDDNKRIVGYTMERLFGWHGLHEITTANGSKALGMDLRSTGLMLAALSRAVRLIHGQGFVIGDFNSSNALFTQDGDQFLVKVIDVDSWSIYRPDLGIEYASKVLDRGEIYHPDIIQADRAGKPWPRFTPDHDWWAFACICWQVLTKFDPYQRGKHEAITDKEERILKNLTANSAAAVRLGFASADAIQALGPKLRFYLDRCLKRKVRRPFPTKILEDFSENLRQCACGFTAHASAVICPKCAEIL